MLRSLFGEMGINYTLMTQLIARSKVKVLTEEEKKELRTIIDALEEIIESRESGPDLHPVDNLSIVRLRYQEYLANYGG